MSQRIWYPNWIQVKMKDPMTGRHFQLLIWSEVLFEQYEVPIWDLEAIAVSDEMMTIIAMRDYNLFTLTHELVHAVQHRGKHTNIHDNERSALATEYLLKEILEVCPEFYDKKNVQCSIEQTVSV